MLVVGSTRTHRISTNRFGILLAGKFGITVWLLDYFVYNNLNGILLPKRNRAPDARLVTGQSPCLSIGVRCFLKTLHSGVRARQQYPAFQVVRLFTQALCKLGDDFFNVVWW